MTLKALIGSGKYLNKKLLMNAAKNTPSLIIDCANCANPHALFPDISMEQLNNMYVIELELLYKFRDALLRVPSIAENLGIKSIIITTSDSLFHYQDEEENKDIIEHSWEIMQKLGKDFDIEVGINFHSNHMDYAKKYADSLGDMYGSYCIKPTHDG